jgi:hypothetical protein
MKRPLAVCLLFVSPVLAGTHGVIAAELESEAISLAEPLKYTRLYADPVGASHFADEEIPFTLVDFAPPAPAISLSRAFGAQAVAMMSSPSGWHGDWHPAPQRQFIFVLTGDLEVQVSDGEVRTFGPGAVVLVEDTFGQGHISRVVSKERTYCVVVPLAGDADAP